MGLNDTPSANRIHISFFGCRNAGKSSLVNRLTNQEVSIVSDKKGTTTDPVKKAMELLPLGPVVLIDTPGYDDEGELGGLRIERTRQILETTDAAILVVDSSIGLTKRDAELINEFKSKDIAYLVAYNKNDLKESKDLSDNEVSVSAKSGDGIENLKERIGKMLPSKTEKRFMGDLINKGDTVVLVIPIDSSAPKGRIILPQQQALRDILDSNASAVVCRETELATTLDSLKEPPRLVVTDSQVFKKVAEVVPDSIMLTSFSILMARYKGFLDFAVKGASTIDKLCDGDRVLISEGCTHRKQCEDIGTVKIPRLIAAYTNKKIDIETSSGESFPRDLSKYALVIHCGGCMLNEREMQRRIKLAAEARIPLTNYGTAIAYMTGILKRSLKPFPNLSD